MMNIEFTTKEENLHYPEVWDIEPNELRDFIDRYGLENLQLIDVRLKEEFDSSELGHITGSRLIPLDEVSEHLLQFDRVRPIVFICRSGWRSARAASLVAEYGFNQVYNLKGGLLYWNEQLSKNCS